MPDLKALSAAALLEIAEVPGYTTLEKLLAIKLLEQMEGDRLPYAIPVPTDADAVSKVEVDPRRLHLFLVCRDRFRGDHPEIYLNYPGEQTDRDAPSPLKIAGSLAKDLHHINHDDVVEVVFLHHSRR